MKGRLLSGVILLILLFGLASPVVFPSLLAQTGGYGLSWWSVAGGGGTSTGGAYTLSGSMGQPDASTSTGGSYSVDGGFWAALAAVFRAYLPIIMRGK